MKLLERLERKFGRYAVPNVTLGLIIVQVGAYVVGYANMDFRYCTKCGGSYCYCSEHLRNHEHLGADKESGED